MIRQVQSTDYSRSLNHEKAIDFPFAQIIGKIVKRIFDIVAALFGLIILSPLFIYIIHLIKRDSPGPVFYWGPRAGLGGKTFHMLKFRTMYECPTSYDGPRVTCKDDGRITPIGHWLRTTKINELPQLWNVLIGDMSWVGPRPEDADIARTWSDEMKREILSVRPGITSPASILYHDEEDLLPASNVMGEYFKSIMPDKMRLDLLYVRNHSFFADLDIIFWTVAILLPRVVKARIPEGYLFAGPFSRFIDRYVSWFLVDLLITFGASITAVLVWRSQEPLNWGAEHLIILSTSMALIFASINSLTGLKNIVWAEAIAEDASGLMFSAAIATLVMIGGNYLQSIYHWLHYPALPITMIFTIGLMASIGFVVARYRWRLITGFASRWLNWRNGRSVAERVLIVGSGEGSTTANWLLKHGEGSRLLSIVGVVDNELPAMHGMRVKGNPLLGGLTDIPDIIKQYDVGVVIFAIPKSTIETQEKVSEYCRQSNTHLVYLSDLLSALQMQLTQPSPRNRVETQTT